MDEIERWKRSLNSKICARATLVTKELNFIEEVALGELSKSEQGLHESISELETIGKKINEEGCSSAKCSSVDVICVNYKTDYMKFTHSLESLSLGEIHVSPTLPSPQHCQLLNVPRVINSKYFSCGEIKLKNLEGQYCSFDRFYIPEVYLKSKDKTYKCFVVRGINSMFKFLMLAPTPGDYILHATMFDIELVGSSICVTSLNSVDFCKEMYREFDEVVKSNNFFRLLTENNVSDLPSKLIHVGENKKNPCIGQKTLAHCDRI